MGTTTRAKRARHRDGLRCRLAFDLMNTDSLSSERIHERYYLGLSDASFHKTFSRDRAALAEQGVFLSGRKDGNSKVWSLDRARCEADSDDGTARALAHLTAALLDDPSFPDTRELGLAIARIGQADAGEGEGTKRGGDEAANPEVIRLVAKCLESRTPCALLYRSLDDGSPLERRVLPYGIFELEGRTYLVGLRSKQDAPDALRTLNLARAEQAREAGEAGSYEMPRDFDVRDHVLLPFEIGAEPPAKAVFHIPSQAAAKVFDAIRERGRLESEPDGSAVWTIAARDLESSAHWAIGQGIYPLAPDSLVRIWEGILQEVTGRE